MLNSLKLNENSTKRKVLPNAHDYRAYIRQKYCLLNCLANFKHEPVCLMTSMSAVCLQSESIKSLLMVWNVFAKFLVSDARMAWY